MSSLGSPGYYSPRPQDQLDGTHPHSSNRKRVGKACDRCRLKKSKCDGSNPCHRCNQADQVCTFTERKRPKGRVYPDGYVEILESKCQVLIQGLIELDRLRKNLPPTKPQSTTGMASGKQANQILKDIGVNTTLTDSDLEDEDDGHEPGYCQDDEDCMTSSNGSPEPSDSWMQNPQQPDRSRSQNPPWSQSPLRHSSQYYPQGQVMDSGLVPPSPPMGIDYNPSGLAHNSTNPQYYSHASLELQIPTSVIDPNMLPPSPPRAPNYNSPHSATSTSYVAGQLPSFYNDMSVFTHLSAMAPASGEQNYFPEY